MKNWGIKGSKNWGIEEKVYPYDSQFDFEIKIWYNKMGKCM
jgi:hypothetical protein